MSVSDLTNFLNRYFRTERYPEAERGGLFYPTELHAPVRRLGLALEPVPALPDWVREYELDALWLHRPWRLDANALPPTLPVLFHHLPFDETLTMGFNAPLAEALRLINLEEFGHKQTEGYPPRAIGMIGDGLTRSGTAWQRWIETEFGGVERVHEGRFTAITRVAVVGAMNEALLRDAAQRGAQLYLTGQYRPSARGAVDETGLNVLAVGHERSERWGLHALADLLRRTFPDLVVQTLK